MIEEKDGKYIIAGIWQCKMRFLRSYIIVMTAAGAVQHVWSKI